MTAAVEALTANTDVNDVIIMGYCFGGTGAAEIIRNPPEALIGGLGGEVWGGNCSHLGLHNQVWGMVEKEC